MGRPTLRRMLFARNRGPAGPPVAGFMIWHDLSQQQGAGDGELIDVLTDFSGSELHGSPGGPVNRATYLAGVGPGGLPVMECGTQDGYAVSGLNVQAHTLIVLNSPRAVESGGYATNANLFNAGGFHSIAGFTNWDAPASVEQLWFGGDKNLNWDTAHPVRINVSGVGLWRVTGKRYGRTAGLHEGIGSAGAVLRSQTRLDANYHSFGSAGSGMGGSTCRTQRVAEIIVYPFALTDAELLLVWAYLTVKWSL